MIIVAYVDRQGDVLPILLIDSFADEWVFVASDARGYIGRIGNRFAQWCLLKAAIVATIDKRSHKVEIQVVVVRQIMLVIDVQRGRNGLGALVVVNGKTVRALI